MALEYHVIAPRYGVFRDAIQQLIPNITAIKNPKSMVTLDEMARIYGASKEQWDPISKEIRDGCLAGLADQPSEVSFRMLARHASPSGNKQADADRSEVIFNGMNTYEIPTLREWKTVAEKLKTDRDENVRAFAAKVLKLQASKHSAPPMRQDANDPFRS